MAATSKVINTTELLEAILYELPTRDLLFAQLISKTFKASIDDSTQLQRALFFTPIPVDALPSRPAFSDLGGGLVRKPGVVKNPLLEHYVDSLATFESDPDDDYVYVSPPCHPSYSAPNATWTRMLPCQPAIHRSFYVMYRELGVHYGAQMPEGVLDMGSIVSELDKVVDQEVAADRWFGFGAHLDLKGAVGLRSNHDLDTLIAYHRKKAAGDENAQYVLSEGDE